MNGDDEFEECLDVLADKIYVVASANGWDSDGKILQHKVITPRMTRTSAMKYVVDNKDIEADMEHEHRTRPICTKRYYIAHYKTPRKEVLSREQAGMLMRMVPEYIELHFIVDSVTGEVTDAGTKGQLLNGFIQTIKSL